MTGRGRTIDNLACSGQALAAVGGQVERGVRLQLADAPKERPILFSAPMVRALLDGTKTQTRRLCKPQPDIAAESGARVGVFTPDDQRLGRLGKALLCPYGQPGDKLWAREAWRTASAWDCTPPRDLPGRVDLHYEANGRPNAHFCFGKLRPGMFMPRAASRITLEVTGVRVERLQDISEADALAEGVTPKWEPGCSGRLMEALGGFGFRPAASAYADLWEQINGPGAWDLNPWVWVVEFRRLHLQPNVGAEPARVGRGRLAAEGQFEPRPGAARRRLP